MPNLVINAYFEAEIQEAPDIANLLPWGVLEKLKARVKHPFLVLLKIGTEGTSIGDMPDDRGRKRPMPKDWKAPQIRDLAEAVDGLPITDTPHNKGANGPRDDKGGRRRTVGRVIHSYAERVDGKETAFAIAHIKKPDVIEAIKNRQLSTSSFEGVMNFIRAGGRFIVSQIQRMDRITLHGPDVTPGFAGAGVMASVQETTTGLNKKDWSVDEGGNAVLGKGKGKKPKGQRKPAGVGGQEDELMDAAEVRAAIAKLGLKPSELFEAPIIMALPMVVDALGTQKTTLTEQGAKALADQKADLQGKVDAAEKKLEDTSKAAKEAAAKKAAEEIAASVKDSDLIKDLPKNIAEKVIARVSAKEGLTAENLDAEIKGVVADYEGMYKAPKGDGGKAGGKGTKDKKPDDDDKDGEDGKTYTDPDDVPDDADLTDPDYNMFAS